MTIPHTNKFNLSDRGFLILLVLIALAITTVSAWMAAIWADRELRTDLLRQAHMISTSINPRQVAALSGSEADLASADYLSIKEQLSRIRLSNPDCRFLYLVSRRSNGNIIIYVDSEPTGSKDYSPPGQVYEEASRGLHSVFDTGRPSVEGPISDRWGTWVSAFVPLSGPADKGVQMVFGMDIIATAWKRTVLLQAALPAALVAVAVILGLFATAVYRSRRSIRIQQDKLRESEEKFRTLIENSHDIIYTLTPEGVFTFVSPSWTALLGHPVSQVVRKPFQSFVHPDDVGNCETYLQKVIETGQRMESIEYRVQHADGFWRWHNSTGAPIRDEAGKTVGYQGIARDITEHRQAEESLKESENKFRVLSEKAMVGVYLIQDEIFKYLNPKFYELFGYSEDEILLKAIKDFIVPEDWPMVKEYFRKRISGEIDSLCYELRIVKKNGDIAFVEAHGSRILYEGQPTIIGTILDISDRKRAEKEVQRRLKLEGTLEMAGAICHEMNQPMQTILGYSDLLLMNISQTDTIYEKIDEITKQIERMCEITRKLMSINDIETKDYAGISRIVDIDKLPGKSPH